MPATSSRHLLHLLAHWQLVHSIIRSSTTATLKPAYESIIQGVEEAETAYKADPNHDTATAFIDRSLEIRRFLELCNYFNKHELEAAAVIPRTLGEIIDDAPGSADHESMWAAMDQTMLGIAHRWEAGEVLELVGIYEPILRAHRETCATCPQPYGQGPAEDDGSSDINDEEFPRDENAEVAEATGEQIQ